jgi:serine/threonine protein kinase
MDASPRPFGKYFLVQKIAVGGMAEIYKAKTFGVDGFEKTVVIKKILPHWASDPDFIRMLHDEAKLSVLLNHPNIVEVFDLGSVDKENYIAMAYVEGLDLRTLMNAVQAKGMKIPPDVASFIAMQTAAGLDYAHKKTGADGAPLHIIHRDVSPHNILLSHHGEVKITDFGIAKAASKKSFTATGTLKGKFNYMSPEQVRSEPLTPQGDIFSLGLVLYEMLTGKKCFEADTEVGVIEKVKNAKINLDEIEAVSPDLKPVLAKALAPSPSDRYASAEQMQMDLAQVLAKLHPGFLPKDLALFIKDYKPEIPADAVPRTESAPGLAPVSQSAATSISYIPGFQVPPSAAKKGRSIWVWMIPLLLLFFGSLAGAAYFAWTRVIQPRLASKMSVPPPSPTLPTAVTPAPPPPPPSVTATTTPPPAPVPVETQPSPSLQAAATQPASQPASQPSESRPMAGSLDLKSNPPGAAIFLDNQDTGLKTPATVPQIPLSVEHTVTLKSEGFKDWEKKILLTNTAPLNLEGNLEKVMWGQAYLVSSPDGAFIFVDGQPTNLTTPATVGNLTLNQPHRIRLMKRGYFPLEAVYTPTTGEAQRLDLPLREAPFAQTPRPKRPYGFREGGGAPLRQTPPAQGQHDSGIMLWR